MLDRFTRSYSIIFPWVSTYLFTGYPATSVIHSMHMNMHGSYSRHVSFLHSFLQTWGKDGTLRGKEVFSFRLESTEKVYEKFPEMRSSYLAGPKSGLKTTKNWVTLYRLGDNETPNKCNNNCEKRVTTNLLNAS